MGAAGRRGAVDLGVPRRPGAPTRATYIEILRVRSVPPARRHPTNLRRLRDFLQVRKEICYDSIGIC